MSEAAESSESAESAASAASARAEWERRKRRAEVFGDAVPTTTSDERDDESPRERGDAGDAWLRAQVPPHHGS